ncbi:hypothetical protein HDU97_007499 [Phlyctochytrium planicorne]|nr:hypothetical protein HDU97_007499 [Phlyctochytrium planicorne]
MGDPVSLGSPVCLDFDSTGNRVNVLLCNSPPTLNQQFDYQADKGWWTPRSAPNMCFHYNFALVVRSCDPTSANQRWDNIFAPLPVVTTQALAAQTSSSVALLETSTQTTSSQQPSTTTTVPVPVVFSIVNRGQGLTLRGTSSFLEFVPTDSANTDMFSYDITSGLIKILNSGPANLCMGYYFQSAAEVGTANAWTQVAAVPCSANNSFLRRALQATAAQFDYQADTASWKLRNIANTCMMRGSFSLYLMPCDTGSSFQRFDNAVADIATLTTIQMAPKSTSTTVIPAVVTSSQVQNIVIQPTTSIEPVAPVVSTTTAASIATTPVPNVFTIVNRGQGLNIRGVSSFLDFGPIDSAGTDMFSYDVTSGQIKILNSGPYNLCVGYYYQSAAEVGTANAWTQVAAIPCSGNDPNNAYHPTAGQFDYDAVNALWKLRTVANTCLMRGSFSVYLLPCDAGSSFQRFDNVAADVSSLTTLQWTPTSTSTLQIPAIPSSSQLPTVGVQPTTAVATTTPVPNVFTIVNRGQGLNIRGVSSFLDFGPIDSANTDIFAYDPTSGHLQILNSGPYNLCMGYYYQSAAEVGTSNAWTQVAAIPCSGNDPGNSYHPTAGEFEYDAVHSWWKLRTVPNTCLMRGSFSVYLLPCDAGSSFQRFDNVAADVSSLTTLQWTVTSTVASQLPTYASGSALPTFAAELTTAISTTAPASATATPIPDAFTIVNRGEGLNIRGVSSFLDFGAINSANTDIFAYDPTSGHLKILNSGPYNLCVGYYYQSAAEVGTSNAWTQVAAIPCSGNDPSNAYHPTACEFEYDAVRAWWKLRTIPNTCLMRGSFSVYLLPCDAGSSYQRFDNVAADVSSMTTLPWVPASTTASQLPTVISQPTSTKASTTSSVVKQTSEAAQPEPTGPHANFLFKRYPPLLERRRDALGIF